MDFSCLRWEVSLASNITAIRNKIGKTSAELVERWNSQHPDDPVV
jgi:hypothetical protein